MREKKSPFDGRVPPLNTLRVFEAAARLESFVQAAEELHVTHGAVSRQVKQLETALGVTLFERRNRAVFRTPQAARLLEACTAAMGTLAEAMRALRAPEESSPLVVSCEPTIAMRWLIPRLARLRQRHPAHQVHLLTAGGKVDFARDRVDVALRRNDFHWGEHCHAEQVAEERMGPVCVPALAQAVRDGQAVPLLHARTRPSAWPRWADVSGRPMRAAGSSQFEHFYLSLQAAGAGLGVALGSAYMVHDDLRDGRLVAPLGFVPDGSAYVLLSPVPFDADPRRARFLAWLREEMQASTEPVDELARPEPVSSGRSRQGAGTAGARSTRRPAASGPERRAAMPGRKAAAGK
ncbi:LysR substrate-binding domain-containing protein [Rhizobacter sp. LjRoot28]|uniref:LysR substrate-binding domain-containing protein n=1 Tax=Rhizobacter sp. LjRoot28 TaxID=3342309 RepID=UPI003F4F6272